MHFQCQSVFHGPSNSNCNFHLHLDILTDRHQIVVRRGILHGLLHPRLHGCDGVLLPARGDRAPVVVHLGLVPPQRVLDVRREMQF